VATTDGVAYPYHNPHRHHSDGLIISTGLPDPAYNFKHTLGSNLALELHPLAQHDAHVSSLTPNYRARLSIKPRRLFPLADLSRSFYPDHIVAYSNTILRVAPVHVFARRRTLSCLFNSYPTPPSTGCPRQCYRDDLIDARRRRINQTACAQPGTNHHCISNRTGVAALNRDASGGMRAAQPNTTP